MKNVLLYLFLFITAASLNAQTARSYFPQNTGHEWYFEVAPLDSLNNPVSALTYVQADSFAASGTYLGKAAEIVLSKFGNESIINLLPYTDTTYYSFEGDNGWVYYKAAGLDSLGNFLDSTLAATFIELIESFQDWYSVYRFSQAVNSSYDIFSFDTIITYQSTPLNMRFKLEGKRFADESLSTVIGTFNTKKFCITSRIIYLLGGIIPVPIVETEDTNWIAQDNWVVKRFAPSADIDLTFIGAGSFYIPGLRHDIAEPSVTAVGELDMRPAEYVLHQNYPNPFNPSTIIRYSLKETGFTSLIIYDVLGNEIEKLVNQDQPPGSYEINFDAEGIASGIYYYRLTSGSFRMTGKMVYLR